MRINYFIYIVHINEFLLIYNSNGRFTNHRRERSQIIFNNYSHKDSSLIAFDIYSIKIYKFVNIFLCSV